MEFGGITPVGLPEGWPVLVDEAVVAAGEVVIGSGLRRSKLLLTGADLLSLPGAERLALASPLRLRPTCSSAAEDTPSMRQHAGVTPSRVRVASSRLGGQRPALNPTRREPGATDENVRHGIRP